MTREVLNNTFTPSHRNISQIRNKESQGRVLVNAHKNHSVQ